jgi:serine/threonine protein kinase/streptogramin lyase
MIADPRIGTQLAGYRIEAVIGRGGMSVVYLAEDIRLKRKVALKLLSPELAQSEKFRERFVRESELAASLDHPNIIPIFEAGESEGALYIAMRYVEGTDLGALIEREGGLEPERAVGLLAQAAGALDTAHARGLIHRDVKPSNMLIAAGTSRAGLEHLYLSDFGVTKRSTSDSGITGTGQFVGTLDYAAPEQFEGRALDARTDVYSLGCVLYECLTGEVPFQRDTQAALVYAHLMSPPPAVTDKRPGLAEGIDEVVATGMAKVPEKRYASAGELVEAAHKTLAPAAVIEVTNAQQGGSKRRMPILIGAGAALVVLVVVLVTLLSRSGGGGPSLPSASSTGAGLAASDRVDRLSQVRSDVALARTVPLKVGNAPSGVVVGEGSVWITNEGDGTVSRIDPVTNQARVIRVGKGPDALAVGEDSIWVVNRLGHSVSRIDPGTNRVEATIDVSGGFPGTIAVGEGAVWIGVEGDYPLGVHLATVHKIDPQSNQDVASIPIEGALVWVVITTGGGAVWAVGNAGNLVRIDPSTTQAQAITDLGEPPGAIALADGALWVASVRGEVLKVDPATGRVEARVPGGGSPGGLQGTGTREAQLAIAVGDGIIWVTGKVDGSISRIVSVSGTALEPIKVGLTPTGVAVGFGSVWVTVDASG